MERIICFKNDRKKDFVRTPSLSTLNILMKKAREQATYHDSSVISFAERMQDRTASELMGNKVVYHES